MSSTPSDPKQVLAALSRRAIALELSTLDLCFLAALHLRGTAAQLTAFDEDQLIDIFEQVCALDAAAPEAPKQRATPAIRRLREQRLLARIDGAGVLRAGEYALTRLASGIVEFFLQDEALTHESLTLLTRGLLSSLAEVLAGARAATSSKETWRSEVVGPLRVTVFDLVSGIERRQRGFDLQQQEFQRQIAELLEADWFGALDRCQELLEATSATLRELNQVLLHDMHEVQTSLQDVQELAVAQAQPEAEQATRAVSDQIDRIVAWGSARQRAWSEYYQYVHRYLRDVVRLDPSRTLVHRLREQLAGRRGRRFGLRVAAAPGIRLLRTVESQAQRPPVRRPRKERDLELAASSAEDPRVELELRVRAALAAGAAELSQVTAAVTGEQDGALRFVTTGRIAETVARVSRPRAAAERPWVLVDPTLSIEEWSLLSLDEKR